MTSFELTNQGKCLSSEIGAKIAAEEVRKNELEIGKIDPLTYKYCTRVFNKFKSKKQIQEGKQVMHFYLSVENSNSNDKAKKLAKNPCANIDYKYQKINKDKKEREKSTSELSSEVSDSDKFFLVWFVGSMLLVGIAAKISLYY